MLELLLIDRIFIIPCIFSNINEVQRIYYNLNLEIGPRETKPPLPASIPYGDNTYKILQKKLTWYEALKECKKNGMDLANVHNESQQLFLDDIVKRDGYPLWLGLSIHDVSLCCHDCTFL